MLDPHHRDFYSRVYRIRKNYLRGGGFEAAGTLGRSYFVPPPVRPLKIRKFLRAAFLAVLAVTLLKALILSEIGAPAYAQRLTVLEQGDSIARIGAKIMIADPVTMRAAAAMKAVGF